jgi:hypothetical protein
MKKNAILPLRRETLLALSAEPLKHATAGVPKTTLCTIANCPHL